MTKRCCSRRWCGSMSVRSCLSSPRRCSNASSALRASLDIGRYGTARSGARAPLLRSTRCRGYRWRRRRVRCGRIIYRSSPEAPQQRRRQTSQCHSSILTPTQSSSWRARPAGVSRREPRGESTRQVFPRVPWRELVNPFAVFLCERRPLAAARAARPWSLDAAVGTAAAELAQSASASAPDGRERRCSRFPPSVRSGSRVSRGILAGVSHELRTPVNVIRSAAETSHGVVGDPIACGDMATQSRRSARRLGEMGRASLAFRWHLFGPRRPNAAALEPIVEKRSMRRYNGAGRSRWRRGSRPTSRQFLRRCTRCDRRFRTWWQTRSSMAAAIWLRSPSRRGSKALTHR